MDKEELIEYIRGHLSIELNTSWHNFANRLTVTLMLDNVQISQDSIDVADLKEGMGL